MSIFKCEKCGCIENTALCRYNFREKGSPALCSECDPKGSMKWHGCFPKKPFIETKSPKRVKEVCSICGKEMENAIDSKTKKINKYLWKTTCGHNKNLVLARG